MVDKALVSISFKDLETDQRVREALGARCRRLTEKFPETTRFEITLASDGADCTAHGRVTGKDTEVATQATAMELAQAADRLVERMERRLRRGHEKRVLGRRREAQRANSRRTL